MQGKEWLQVDLMKNVEVTGISLQGRWDRGVGQEFTPLVMLKTLNVESGEWTESHITIANRDTNTVVNITLNSPEVTRMVRVVPYSHHMRTVCLRVEIL